MKEFINIKITKEFKNKLIELGVYDDWLFFIQLKFDYYRNKTSDVYYFKKTLQKTIDLNDMIQTISLSIPWFDDNYYDKWRSTVGANSSYF